MSSFIFNGISSDELGLIITAPIIRPTWGKEVSEVTRAGSARKIIQESKTFGNADFVINTVIAEASPENVRSIFSKLSGFGKLLISTAPQEYLDVFIKPLVPEAKALTMAELPINVTALPFAYAVNPTVVDITEASPYVAVENAGTVYSQPEIRFTKLTHSDTVINVNGKGFTIKDPAKGEPVEAGYEIIIDCDVEVAYFVRSNGERVSINSDTYGDFPLLHTGTNYVTHSGDLESASIKVNERWY